jgi:aryl-alcohol dehydrogenase-like predicted oxidoreductase
MNKNSSRRRFLTTGLALPAAGMAATGRRANTDNLPLQLVAENGPKLRYRTLGSTGLKITEMGFGCMVTSDPTVIEAAADIGVNFFDTARSYQGGNNERMVGTALKSKRKDLVLCTKTKARTKAQAIADVETSLKELGTDYVDVLYIHSCSKVDELNDDVVSALPLLKQQGKIRHGGFSTHDGQVALLKAGANMPDIEVILVGYNFTMAQDITDAIAIARKAGKGIVGMKVMAGGFRRREAGDPLFDKFKNEGTMLAALKWVLKDKNVDTTIPSITDMEQLQEDLQSMSTSYTDQDKQLLARQLEYIRPLYCSMCGSCSGVCPKGLPVSDMIRHLSYAEGYGQFQLGRENFKRLPEDIQKVRCDDCDECVIECPNGVHIAERLSCAQELFA